MGSSVDVSTLLSQLKELHAPDRCEGRPNGLWQSVQKVFVSETAQDKIKKHWETNIQQHKTLLKKLTSGSGAEREQMWEICKEVDSKRLPTIDPAKLNEFIDGCNAEQLQKMFNIMIMQWGWRDRLIKAWQIK